MSSPAGELLELYGDGSLRLAGRAMVLAADLHLGKAERFQQAGIAVPSTGLSALDRLGARCREHGDRPVILGDLIHAGSSLTEGIAAGLAAWAQAVRAAQADGLAPILVRGNHDRVSNRRWEELGFLVREGSLEFDGLTLRHAADRLEAAGAGAEAAAGGRAGAEAAAGAGAAAGSGGVSGSPAAGFTISGHLHPVVSLRRGRERLRVPVFLVSATDLVLPAFGPFTGGFRVDRRRGSGWRIFAAGGGEVQEVPPRLL